MSNRDPIRAALSTTPAPVEGDLPKIVEGLKQAAGGAAATGNMRNFGLLVRTIKFLEQQATELAAARAALAAAREGEVPVAGWQPPADLPAAPSTTPAPVKGEW